MAINPLDKTGIHMPMLIEINGEKRKLFLKTEEMQKK